MSKKSTTPRTEPRSLLVHVSGDRIGDALIKLPALRAFRRACPETRITWITGRRPSAFAGALAPLCTGLIDTCHEATGVGTRWRGGLPAFLRERFEVVVSTEARLRETLALRRVPHARFISPALRFALSDAKPAGTWSDASVAERFTMLMTLAAGRDLQPDTALALPAAFEAAAAALLPAGPLYLGLSPGAGGARKRWPLEHFLALAAHVQARGRVPVFFIGPDEADLLTAIRSRIPAARFPEHDAAPDGVHGPLLTIALARRLACAVGNDSGGGHLLAAGGQPLITLYGHTSAAKFRPPYGRRIALLASDFGGRSVEHIPVAAVAAAVERAIDPDF